MQECKIWSKFCDDISSVDGYNRAINDPSDTKYECHHIYETHTSEGFERFIPLSSAELKALGMYYHRPAEELVILTVREHQQLHALFNGHSIYENEEEAEEAHREQIKLWRENNKEYVQRWNKVRAWKKRNINSENFPSSWDKEDVEMFHKLDKSYKNN